MRKKNFIILAFLLLFYLIDSKILYSTNKRTISVGTAKVNITPEIPIPMSGFGNRTDPFKGIHDELFARAVVFSNGQSKASLISADIIGFSHSFWEEIAKRIEHETGIPQKNILLCATHTHGGPTTRVYGEHPSSDVEAYLNLLKENILTAVKEAADNLNPALIGAGKGECKMNMNRRARLAGGEIYLGLNPYGPVDNEVGVVRIDNIKKNSVAFIVNWPCHGTIMGSDNYIITGDWLGATARFIEKEFDGKIIAPVTAGASADITPLYRKTMKFNTRVGEAEITGIILGEEVIRVAKKANMYSNGSISASQRVITLPGKKRPPGPKFRKDGIYNFEPGPNVDVRLSALKIGNIIFAGVSGEVMTEIGMKLKKQSPYTFTFMLTHCNGSSGYLVTDDAYADVGYEVVTSRVMSGAEKAIIENLLDMIKGL